MKKSALLIIALLMALLTALTACSPNPAAPETAAPVPTEQAAAPAPVEETPAPAEEPTAPHWINSDVLGSVTKDMEVSLKDDFHLAINRDWLASAKIPEGETRATAFSARQIEVRQQVLSLLKSEEQANADGKLAQQYFQSYMDMDKRNELGMKPIMPMIKAIQEIKTIDDLTEYATRADQLSNRLVSAGMMADLMDSEHNAVYLESAGLLLGDADEYKNMTSVGERQKQAITPLLQALLKRVEYSESEADAIIEQTFALETQIASQSYGSSDAQKPDFFTKIYNPVTVVELDEMSPVFPITKLLKDYTDAGIERFILVDKNWLSKMNELYTQDNLEAFKAKLICNTVIAGAGYLDQECRDLMDAADSVVGGMEVHSVLEDDAYELCSTYFSMAIGRMYAENFVSPDTKQEIEKVIADTVKIYKQRLEANTWLGAETRAKAVEKLDNLRVRVAYPDDWSKYEINDMKFPENGTLIDYTLEIAKHSVRDTIKNVLEPIDHEKWPQTISPQTINAFYSPNDNSINILAGILGGAVYDPEGSIERTLGGVGIVIGHEITHGFDTRGSQYDKNGNMISWWTDEDRAAFTSKTDKVNAYYSAIEALPGKFVDGELTIGETVADLGGVSCALEMARAYENFDYDLFFRTYAGIWATQTPAETEEVLLKDSHAPGYLRTNVTIQQFQEFYDTYDIKEGDGMYLAPEARLSVW